MTTSKVDIHFVADAMFTVTIDVESIKEINKKGWDAVSEKIAALPSGVGVGSIELKNMLPHISDDDISQLTHMFNDKIKKEMTENDSDEGVGTYL